jgi:hypothetical protein
MTPKGHQKGPWKITSRSGGCCRIGTNDGHTIASVGGRGDEQAFADARRIVRCVNACEGLTLDEVRRAVVAWKKGAQAREAAFAVTCRGIRRA